MIWVALLLNTLFGLVLKPELGQWRSCSNIEVLYLRCIQGPSNDWGRPWSEWSSIPTEWGSLPRRSIWCLCRGISRDFFCLDAKVELQLFSVIFPRRQPATPMRYSPWQDDASHAGSFSIGLPSPSIEATAPTSGHIPPREQRRYCDYIEPADDAISILLSIIFLRALFDLCLARIDASKRRRIHFWWLLGTDRAAGDETLSWPMNYWRHRRRPGKTVFRSSDIGPFVERTGPRLEGLYRELARPSLCYSVGPSVRPSVRFSVSPTQSICESISPVLSRKCKDAGFVDH